MKHLWVVLLLVACTRTLDLGEHESACGSASGSCRPGVQCTASCLSCFCDANGGWRCSDTCPHAGDGCPTKTPIQDTTCTGDATCTYATACKTLDKAACIRGTWSVFLGTCADPSSYCPPPDSAPPLGKDCPIEKLSCQFLTKCGLPYYAFCSSAMPWTSEPAPPCPDKGCPADAPPSGSTCDVDASCSWPTECGTPTLGSCKGGTWYVDVGCKPIDDSECMTDKPPPDGSPCKTEGLACKWKEPCAGGQYLDGWCKEKFWVISPCHP